MKMKKQTNKQTSANKLKSTTETFDQRSVWYLTHQMHRQNQT